MGKISISPDRRPSEAELIEALQGRFRRQYEVFLQPVKHGPPFIIVKKSAFKGLRIRLSDGTIGVHGTLPSVMVTWLLALLGIPLVFVPILIGLLLHRASWKKMGEETTSFLKSKYGPRTGDTT